MKTGYCEKCGTEFVQRYRSINPKRFCSRTCANSRNWTDEDKKKKSNSNKNFWKNLSDDDKKRNYNQIVKQKETNRLRLLEMEFDKIKAHSTRRKRILIEQENKCFECGISDWHGKALPLELDHIDGNKKNNTRGNLRAICPNCHSLTPNWRGRNMVETV